MRICLDVTYLFDQYYRRGIGRYGIEMTNLFIDAAINGSTELHLIGFDSLAEVYRRLGRNDQPFEKLRFHRLSGPTVSHPILNIFNYYLQLRPKIHELKPDLYYAFHFERGVPTDLVPTAVAVHDAIPLVTGQFSRKSKLVNWLKGMYYRRFMWQKLLDARYIFTSSQVSARELVEFGKLRPEVVNVVYLGISDIFRKQNLPTDKQLIAATLEKYDLSNRPYLIYDAGFEANKNTGQLLEIFAQLKKQHPELYLVVTGTGFEFHSAGNFTATNERTQEFMSAARQLRISGAIVGTGRVSELELATLLANAEVYVNMSDYEGFGFGPLQAMAAGVPAVIADQPCFKEVSGAAAMLTNPYNVDESVEKLHKVLTDKELRGAQISLGQTHSEKFNWKQTFNQTWEICAPKNISANVLPGQLTRQLSLAYIIARFHPFKGGAEQYTLELAKRAAATGHQVSVLTTDVGPDGTRLPKYESLLGMQIIRSRAWNRQLNLGFYPDLLWQLLTHKFQVIHISNGPGFIWRDICLMIKKLVSMETKLIISPHGGFLVTPDTHTGIKQRVAGIAKLLMTPYFKLMWAPLFSAAIQVNPAQEKWIRGEYGFRKQPVYLIPNGISAEMIIDKKPSVDPIYPLTITYVGRMEKYKGIHTVIQALSKLREQDLIGPASKNVKFAIISHIGPFYRELLKLIADLDMNEYVEIIPNADDAQRDKILTEVSQIHILPSQKEATGIVLLEAMAKGNAIITTYQNEAAPLLIEPGKNGYIFNFDDAPALTEILKELINNSSLRRDMINYNLEYIKQFTWEQTFPKYLQMLDSLQIKS